MTDETPQTLTSPEETTVTTPTITREQYIAAIEALGLDPNLTVQVSLQADWAHVTLAETDEDGMPIVDLGRLTTRSLPVQIQDGAIDG